MASIVRVGVSKLLIGNGSNILSLVPKTGCRGISGKCLRSLTKTFNKPQPWPYTRKGYTILNYFFDKTSARFDENSKIIVVEGPIAAGKTKVAKKLAEEFGMLYMPEGNLDMMYINDYGFNLKTLDEQVPESCRSFDVNNFMLNPKHRLAASFQLKQYSIKFSQYIDALAHVFSTGQGVVMDRCVYSDFVFMEAMCSHGYMSKGARSVYYDLRKNSIDELLRPHLVVYLDTPVSKVQENVCKRKISYEVNSPVLTEDYLDVMEKYYKQDYLKTIGKHAELLIYDWSNEGDVEIVVEDIERIDFNKYDDQDTKMSDWVYHLEEEYAYVRHMYADKKHFLLSYLNVPRFDVPELVNEADDVDAFKKVWNEAPGMKYAKGYNTTLGDKGLLFKVAMEHRHTLPRTERKIC